MIETIHVEALKSIKDLRVNCSKFNLFVGTNSSGKSTFMQALLLLAQKDLNGKYISLGEFREVRNYYMSQNSIRIEMLGKNKKKPAWIEFIENKEKDSYGIKTSLEDEVGIEELLGFNERIDPEQTDSLCDESGFHYLSCHRVGARDIYAKNMLDENDFGIDGEYALAYLLKNESKVIPEELVVKNEKITNSLLDQVNFWLNYIVGTTLIIKDIKKTNYLQVNYNNNPANISSEALYCRPVNVGSGISYLISIIISCLGSEYDSIIVIENPEIHLHPKAQSRLCEFLLFVSNDRSTIFCGNS